MINYNPEDLVLWNEFAKAKRAKVVSWPASMKYSIESTFTREEKIEAIDTYNTRSNLAHLKGLKRYLERHTFMIGEGLRVMGEYDGWSQWYGLDNRFEEFQDWVNEGRIALNIHQTKTSSIRPQYIELMKKHNTWKV